jgi:hypothetical protein
LEDAIEYSMDAQGVSTATPLHTEILLNGNQIAVLVPNETPEGSAAAAAATVH